MRQAGAEQIGAFGWNSKALALLQAGKVRCHSRRNPIEKIREPPAREAIWDQQYSTVFRLHQEDVFDDVCRLHLLRDKVGSPDETFGARLPCAVLLL